ncbi:hypothetical protein JJP89_22205, partial [Enterobacter hormaechei]|nr:hypothetical protein [Enterobacter hormaechei]
DKFITTDYLQQCRKLRRRTVTVRSIQRPAQPRQCVQADTRFEGTVANSRW